MQCKIWQSPESCVGMQTIEELEEQRKAITAAAKQAALLAAQEREKNLASIETERGSGRDLQACLVLWSEGPDIKL